MVILCNGVFTEFCRGFFADTKGELIADLPFIVETKGELIAEAVWPLRTGVKFKILLLFLGELTICWANLLTLAASISKASLSKSRLILEFLLETWILLFISTSGVFTEFCGFFSDVSGVFMVPSI